MVSVCLPSDALLQHLPILLGFLLLWMWGLSPRLLHQSTATALTLDEGYLPTATPSDLECGVAPLSPPVPMQHRPLDVGLLLLAARPYLVMIDIHHFIFYTIVLLV